MFARGTPPGRCTVAARGDRALPVVRLAGGAGVGVGGQRTRVVLRRLAVAGP